MTPHTDPQLFMDGMIVFPVAALHIGDNIGSLINQIFLKLHFVLIFRVNQAERRNDRIGDKIAATIDDLGGQPVTFVVNTHFHYDHTDGNENFGRAGAYIVAQDNARKRMEATQVLTGGRVQEAYDPVGLPSITFFDEMRFYFNGQTTDLVNTGNGHTDGDAQVYFREANVVHTGDMFVRYGLPFIDIDNGGTLDGMIDAVSNLASLIDGDTIISPGHGQLSDRQDLLDYRNMLVEIRGGLVRAKLQGLSTEEMLATSPAAEFAPSNDNTATWLTRAYTEYQDR